jgi:hypothetical protein
MPNDMTRINPSQAPINLSLTPSHIPSHIPLTLSHVPSHIPPDLTPSHIAPAERHYRSASLQPQYGAPCTHTHTLDTTPTVASVSSLVKLEGGWGRGGGLYPYANVLPSRGPGSYVRPPPTHMGESGGAVWGQGGAGGRSTLGGLEYGRGISIPGFYSGNASQGLQSSLGGGRLGEGRVTDPLSRDLYPAVGMC